MHLNHSTEDKEVGWSCNLNILHRPDNRIQTVAIMTHHGTGIDKIMPILRTGLLMSIQYILKQERLWCTGY